MNMKKVGYIYPDQSQTSLQALDHIYYKNGSYVVAKLEIVRKPNIKQMYTLIEDCTKPKGVTVFTIMKTITQQELNQGYLCYPDSNQRWIIQIDDKQ